MTLNPWHGLRGLPREMWVLAGVTLVNRAGTMVMPFLALYLIRERGVAPGRTGLALTVYGVGALLAAPLAGWLTDRFTPLRVMVGSLLLGGAVALALPWTSGFAQFLVLVFLWAIVAEAFRPANLAAVSDLVPAEQRRPAFALVRLSINLGMSIGPAVGGLLVALSFSALFWVDGLTSIAAGCLLAANTARWRRGGDQHQSAAPVRAPNSAFRDRRLLFLLFAGIPVVAVFFQIQGAMAVHVVENLGWHASAFGLLFALNTGLIVLTEVPLNLRLARYPPRLSLIVGSLLIGLGFGAFAFASSVAQVVAAVVVWTCGEMAVFSALPTAVADLAPAERRGEYMGLFQLSFGIAFVLGPWAGTAALAGFGPVAMWAGAAAVAATSALLFSRSLPAAAANRGC
jgi:predicted MFS family arabinose efflux permease